MTCELVIELFRMFFLDGAIVCVYVCASLKMECEKLSQEKTEMQRHYVMVSRPLELC